MIANGTTPTSADTIYTVPSPAVGVVKSGSIREFNLLRFVNTSDTDTVTLSIWLNVNGTARLLSPKNLSLIPGAAWDDVPVFQLPVGATVVAEAGATGVDWTLNSYFVEA